MSAVFLKVLNMSITVSWMIPAVVLVRLLLKKAPKWIPCLLWGLVAVRLICPFSFESALSLIPSGETIPVNIAEQHDPAVASGITIVNKAVNPVAAESFAPAPADSANPLQIMIPVAAIIWIAGIVIMLAYALISCIKLKKTVSVCVPAGDRILSCDEVRAPFILGVFRPVVYVPSSMTGETLDLVIRHETAHLQRRDHLWKPLGYLLLAVYWFNPLCWIAYILLCRDIEMACDEKVIRDMDKNDMAAYSQALLDCSFPRRRIAACPLAFGEAGVKERVKGILNYRKPAFWIVVVAVAACVVIGMCFLTSPIAAKDSMTYVHHDSAVGRRADFNVDIGKNVKGAELTVEMWQNGQCTSGSPVLVPSHTEKITLLFSDRRENLDLIGEDIQIDIDETAGALVSYFPFPEHIVGWSFTSWQDNSGIPVKPGEDVILAAMTCDTGSGVRSFDCQSLSSEPERLTSAECMIVVRAKFYETDVSDIGGGEIDMEGSRAKYPEYFDLDTFKGLEVYVWQLAPGSYSCGVLPGTDREKTLEELMALKGASIEEMRLILSSYEIDEKDVFIIPWQNPISSYLCDYWVSQENEDPAAMEKRRQEYVDGIRQMLFGDAQAAGHVSPDLILITEQPLGYGSPIIDSASLDIDSDGVFESCSVTFGPTSGLLTVVITASADGRIKYKNTFNLARGNVSFAEKDGVPQFVRDGEYHRLYVEDGRIVIEGLDPQYEGYWGGSDWNYDMS